MNVEKVPMTHHPSSSVKQIVLSESGSQQVMEYVYLLESRLFSEEKIA